MNKCGERKFSSEDEASEHKEEKDQKSAERKSKEYIITNHSSSDGKENQKPSKNSKNTAAPHSN